MDEMSNYLQLDSIYNYIVDYVSQIFILGWCRIMDDDPADVDSNMLILRAFPKMKVYFKRFFYPRP